MGSLAHKNEMISFNQATDQITYISIYMDAAVHITSIDISKFNQENNVSIKSF